MQNITRAFPRAAQLRTRPSVDATDTVLNREGAPSFRRSLEEQAVQVLTTGTLGDTFYASSRELGEEAVKVLTEMRDSDPEFLARALVFAREKGLMKSVPTLGLAILSGGRGRTKPLFDAVFNRVVRIPDDLRAFVALCKSGSIPGVRGLGGMRRTAVRKWLQGLSEYHAVKYGSSASREVTLRDILRMSHPTPSSPALAERFGWLVKGVEGLGSDLDLNPQIRALEALKRATSEQEQISLIREGRLPYEVVVPSVSSTTPAIWTELLRQAPFFNLLRNLVTFNRHGVFAEDENVDLAISKFASESAVKRSKVLPFRFFDAYKAWNAKSGVSDSRISDALREALELSFANMPSFGGRTVAIGPDTSGSMSWGSVSRDGSTRYIDIAGIFTGALLKQIGNRAVVLPFDTTVHLNHGLSPRDDLMVTVEKLVRFGGGGTAVGAPVQHLLRSQTKVDVFIGITDHEDWAYGRSGWGNYECEGSFLDMWLRYKSEIAPNAVAFLVTIDPGRASVAPSGVEDVHFIYGWNDAVLKYIGMVLDSGSGQVEDIRKMDLRTGD